MLRPKNWMGDEARGATRLSGIRVIVLRQGREYEKLFPRINPEYAVQICELVVQGRARVVVRP